MDLPASDEHERSRETAYRPDGSVAGVRDWERWRDRRQSAGLLSPGTRSLREDAVECLLLFAGVHVLLAIAVGVGALAKAAGHNPVAGYALAWVVMYWVFVRPKL